MGELQLVQTAPHEFASYLLFTENGLAPFFSCARAVDSEDGSRHATFTHKDEQWRVELNDRESGLKHPGESIPSGRDFPMEAMREFDIRISPADDPVEERKLHVHITPRWQGMQADSGQEIPLPDDVEAYLAHIKDGGYSIKVTERTLNTVYYQHLSPLKTFFGWLVHHVDYPHVYNPVLLAAHAGGFTREVWYWQTDYKPDYEDRK